MQHRPRRAAPAQPDPAPPRCRTGRRTGRSTTAASSRPSWTGRWRWPTGTASRRAARRRERDGKLRGIGICCFLEVAGGILRRDRRPALRAGRQGGAAHRRAGDGAGASLDLRRRWSRSGSASTRGAVRLVQGDSDEVPAGTPSVASRSIMMAGSATVLACDQAIEKGRRGAGAPARGRRRRHRVRRRHVPRGRHRPRHPDPRSGAAHARRPPMPEELAGGLDNVAKFVVAADELSQRLPRLRGRDRSATPARRGGRPTRRSTTSATCCTRPSSRGRSTAASRRGSGRCWASR